MTDRQALDRAVQRIAGIDIRFLGNWDALPSACIDLYAPELADLCGISVWYFRPGVTIGEIADEIGDVFYGGDFPLIWDICDDAPQPVPPPSFWTTVQRWRVKIKPVFAWYDLWVGAFWDSSRSRLFILPLPCIGLEIRFFMKTQSQEKHTMKP